MEDRKGEKIIAEESTSANLLSCLFYRPMLGEMLTDHVPQLKCRDCEEAISLKINNR